MSQAILSMVLEIEVSRHKREVAEGFAALKAKLTPEPPSIDSMHYNHGMSDAELQRYYLGTQNSFGPHNGLGALASPSHYNNPFCWGAGNNGLGAIWGQQASWF